MELWARKRSIEGKGFPFEFIFSFDNESYKYNAINTLNQDIYQEAMITKEQECIMYVEFEDINIKTKKKVR